MNEEINQLIERLEDRFIDIISENIHAFGASATLGRVLAIIYLNGEPMTLDGLSEETGMSKTRMSQVVRKMSDYHIAHKVYEKGVRKDRYDVEKDFYQVFTSLLTTNWQSMIKKNKRVGQQLQQELNSLLTHEDLDSSTKEKADQLLRESNKWLNFINWLERFTDALESGEIFQYIPKELPGTDSKQ